MRPHYCMKNSSRQDEKNRVKWEHGFWELIRNIVDKHVFNFSLALLNSKVYLSIASITDLEQWIANASTSERVKLNKKLTTLQAQDTEIRTYEEKIHHLADQMFSIDLDDGVKKNCAIFQDVLAKIK